MEAVREGQVPAAVARVLGVARSTIYAWLQQARRPGGLDAKPHPGAPRRLTDAQLRRLARLIARGPKRHGWPNDLWSCARVAQLIRRHFGVSYHPDHVRKLLRRHLDWSPQRPRRKPRERDEEAIARWCLEEFPRQLRQSQRRAAHLVFWDESGFFLTPCLRRTWAPRGRTPILPAWDRRDKLSALSAVTLSPKRRHLNLYFHLLPPGRNARAEDVVAFLKELRRALPGPLTIVWDRSRIHDRSTAVRRWLARHPEVRTVALPAYAPELNPDEGVWGYAKYGRLANLAANDVEELWEHLVEVLVEVKHRPDLLEGFIHETGLPLAA